MLYVTTRNNRDTYTIQHALKANRGPDGGLFVPFHNPVFSKQEVSALLELPFEQCVAQILNRLFGRTLTGWDISFYTGRYPVRIQNLGYRTMIAEAWHNPDWCFDRLVQNLSQLVGDMPSPSRWVHVAVRAAVFAAICGEYQRSFGCETIDIAVVSADFTGPIGAWYARNWGFPIENLICCCNENGNLWDLLANGQMRTDGISIPTSTPDADIVLPDGLEMLIYHCGGAEEVMRYVDVCQRGATYYPSDALLRKLRDRIYVSVVGNHRISEMISRLYTSRNDILSPYDALCYCAVGDYRSRFGETGPVIIFSEKSPIWDSKIVAASIGVPEPELKNYL